MRLVGFNLWEGGHGGGGRRLDLIASVLRALRPDVAVLCEAHGFAEDPRAFADFCAAISLRGQVTLAESGFHVAVLVRTPFAFRSFEAYDVGGLNPIAVARIAAPRLPTGELQVVGAHLDHRSGSARLGEVRGILQLLDPSLPLALVGDLNALSSQDGLGRRDLLALPLHHVPRHVDETGELDARATDELARMGLVDAWRAANPGASVHEGLTVPTSVPDQPAFGPMRIDYVFLSPDLAAALVECRVARDPPADRASDHFPVLAVLDDSRVPRLA
jgi:exodeoxyribonuclease-3